MAQNIMEKHSRPYQQRRGSRHTVVVFLKMDKTSELGCEDSPCIDIDDWLKAGATGRIVRSRDE